jgi:hypothetical protein
MAWGKQLISGRFLPPVNKALIVQIVFCTLIVTVISVSVGGQLLNSALQVDDGFENIDPGFVPIETISRVDR